MDGLPGFDDLFVWNHGSGGYHHEAMKIIRRTVPLNWNQVRPAGLASYAQCKVVHL
jgi:hypothetical protein